MKTKFFTLFFLVISSVASLIIAQKTSLGGVDIPKTYSFNNKSLVLNGSAIREKFFIDIYVGSLYLQEKSSNAKQIINSESDMGFRIKVVSSLINAGRMQSGIKESFGKIAKQYPVAPAVLSKFLALFQDKIKIGDEFFIGYNNTIGLSVHKNGKPIGIIIDLTLKKALFATWLANAVSEKFTSNVLNGN